MGLFKDIWDGLIHLIYPESCVSCGIHEPVPGDLFCVSCAYHLPYTNHFELEDNAFMMHFKGRVPIVHGGALLFYSEEYTQRMIHLFKYQGITKIGARLGQELARKINLRDHQLDAILPVPLHKRKLRQRGFNQSEVIAKQIAIQLGLPCYTSCLLRTKKTATQTKKSREARYANLEGAFHLGPPNEIAKIRDRNVLLIDDVLTTGATLETCANVLIRQAKCQVSMATIAMGQL